MHILALHLSKQHFQREILVGIEGRIRRFEAYFKHVPWASYLSILNLSFLIFEVG